MRGFRESAIRCQLMVVLMIASLAAVTVAGGAFGICDALAVHRALRRGLATLADLAGRQSAPAAASGDRAAALQALAALRVQPGIRRAALYASDGRLLAEYVRAPGSAPLPPKVSPESVSKRREPGVWRQIARGGTVCGAIYLESDGREWAEWLRREVLIGLLTVLGTGAAAWFFSCRLQRLISAPLASLLQTCQSRASGQEQPSPAAGKDACEFGALRDHITQMLAQIDGRNDQLRTLTADLDSQIAARTADLQAEVNQLEAAKRDAEQACRSQTEFLANMSHEIRTPMNAIMGMTELALDADADPTRREYLGLVKSSAESLLTVINDILDLSKIQAGKLDVDETDFSLRDCLGEALKTLAVHAHEKDLELALRVHPDVPVNVISDPTRLRQIVFNLVGNSIKFTEKGEVSVQVSLESGGAEPSVLHFAVADTGIGIPPEKRRVIFEAFAQADNSTTRRYGGTGLGLTISAKLVAMMGGRMWVESNVGQGSTFHFTLKFREGTPAASTGALPAALHDVPALVVDDNFTNRKILDELLRHWGMTPSLAESGRQGLEVLEQANQHGRRFPLILLDCHMPDMDGFTFARQVKTDKRFAGAIIMMLTSGGRRGDASLCRDLGISAYLVKPVQQSELLEAVLSVLGHPEGPGEQRPALVTRHSLREERQHLRILLAEDNSVNQMVAGRLLQKLGHTVMVAGNGRDAVLMLGEQAFDLVLMDVQMPEMDGIEATHVIREKEAATRTHVPIIAMTAHAMKGDRERCLAAGMDDYVAKPIRAAELLAAIQPFTRRVDSAPLEPEAAPEEASIDWDAAWANMEGDRRLMGELARLFLDELPQQMQAIHAAVDQKPGRDLERLAQHLKTSLGNFAAKPAYALASRLETLALRGDSSQMPQAVEALEREIQRFRAALETWAHQPPGMETAALPPCPAPSPGGNCNMTT